MTSENTNSGGITSLGGFAFQIKVFLLNAIELTASQQIEFETIDDIATSKSVSEDFLDKRSEAFQSILDTHDTKISIQVKRSGITTGIKNKILYNWLITDYLYKDQISKYKIITEIVPSLYLINDDFDYDKFISDIATSTKKSTALISKVKNIYSGNEKAIKEALLRIQQKIYHYNYNDIDQTLVDAYSTILHRTASTSELTYTLRLQEVLRIITMDILNSIMSKKPFILTHDSFMTLVDHVCTSITPDQYWPDYTGFRNKGVELTEDILNSREYIQLCTCELTPSLIETHLTYLQYYNDIRFKNLLNNKKTLIENIEGTTYDNFQDVKTILQLDNQDVPKRRLISTKSKSNSYVVNEPAKFGSCIYLTKSDIPELKQISWEDENERD